MMQPGEFDRRTHEDGVEVWVSQMGAFMNMNTAFIDRQNGVVAIIDPFDSNRWVEALDEQGLKPTHLLYTHTHRDHTAGFQRMIRNDFGPELEVWAHREAVDPAWLRFDVFRPIHATHLWEHSIRTDVEWTAGSIQLTITHTPGHAPGHVTIHGHGVYHAGDLLFTSACGRDDLPGGDPLSLWKSIAHAKNQLIGLPSDWRLIPGHRYDWIDGTTPDWVSIEECLEHNYALNSPTLDAVSSME